MCSDAGIETAKLGWCCHQVKGANRQFRGKEILWHAIDVAQILDILRSKLWVVSSILSLRHPIRLAARAFCSLNRYIRVLTPCFNHHCLLLDAVHYQHTTKFRTHHRGSYSTSTACNRNSLQYKQSCLITAGLLIKAAADAELLFKHHCLTAELCSSLWWCPSSTVRIWWLSCDLSVGMAYKLPSLSLVVRKLCTIVTQDIYPVIPPNMKSRAYQLSVCVNVT